MTSISDQLCVSAAAPPDGQSSAASSNLPYPSPLFFL